MSGAMSFNSQMHGVPIVGNQSTGDHSFASTQPSFFNPELSEDTAMRIAALQAKLNQKLGPEYISQRPGPGGGPKLTYAEGWKIINLANEVFGFNGWSSSIVNLTTDFVDYNEESRRYNVGATAIVRVTLRDGVFHEDVGYGMLENSKSKGTALDKCKKEAVTDGLKRALRNFGNLLGNCLYDKAYTQEVVKIKVQPPKFDKSILHRRPEFEEAKPNHSASTSSATSSRLASIATNLSINNTEDVKHNITSTSSAYSSRLANISAHLPSNNTDTSPNPVDEQQTTTSIPSHSRSNIDAVAGPSKSSNVTRNDLSTSSLSARTVLNNLPASTSVLGNRRPHTNLSKDTSRPAAGLESFNVSRPSADPQDQEIEQENGEESYHFGSDDDAFLALVDLGEGDLGQPVLPETDIGRPLFDDNDDGGRLFGSDEVQAHSSVPREKKPCAPGPQVPASIGMLSKLLPQDQPQQQQRSSNPPNTRSRHSQQQWRTNDQNRQQNQQQQQRTSTNQINSVSNNLSRNTNIKQNVPQRIHQDQNQPLAPNGHTPSMTVTRPSTPSMGGFHFPPGVDPRALQGPRSASGIGTKRPLESISSPTNANLGIGISTGASGGLVQVRREVLGSLELGEGGDVKRARR
ncbi:hypothetical protein H2248_012102 [Termitomyces sp. 'cryptogamus']|nr:hypothetical protein H2248_012102 [Termitomyces sp. 'cryptogamus']